MARRSFVGRCLAPKPRPPMVLPPAMAANRMPTFSVPPEGQVRGGRHRGVELAESDAQQQHDDQHRRHPRDRQGGLRARGARRRRARLACPGGHRAGPTGQAGGAVRDAAGGQQGGGDQQREPGVAGQQQHRQQQRADDEGELDRGGVQREGDPSCRRVGQHDPEAGPQSGADRRVGQARPRRRARPGPGPPPHRWSPSSSATSSAALASVVGSSTVT